MGLSSDLIAQFVKTTKDDKKPKKETTAYGTVKVGEDGTPYVQLDGSEISTPISKTVDVKDGDRVIVMIKNHTATITGNLSDPSARSESVSDEITRVEVLIADSIQADKAAIERLTADNVLINEKLVAAEGEIDNLQADNATIDGKLEASKADIENLKTTKLDVEIADAKYATVDKLDATNANVNNLQAAYADFKKTTTDDLTAKEASIKELETKKLDAESAKVIYANIDFSNIGKAAIEQFFSKSGMIGDLVVGDGTITGKLVGVTISGDLIEGNTVKAEKLVVKGSDGLYYKLNIEAGATTSEEVSTEDLQNGLHGTAIIAKTITAEKISVDDLVAFGATIGGFHITEDSLYSGAKASVDNTTRGTYLDSDGQMAVGDSSNFIKYYKDTDGSYKLAISADSIILRSSGPIQDSLTRITNEAQTARSEAAIAKNKIDNLQIGGRNLIPVNRIQPGRNVDTTEEFELRDVWATVFVSADDLAFILDPATEYTIKYNLELIERTSVPTASDMRAGFLIYREGVWIDLGTYGFAEDAEIGDVVSVCKTFRTPNEWAGEQLIVYSRRWTTEGASPIGFDAFKVTNFKIEKGNKATDWTPAPEDMATADDVDLAQSTANEANDKASNAQALIAQLSDSISMLVTDGNGTSLMTQTEDGWTFSTATIQTSVNTLSETLNSLSEEVGDVDNTVDLLQQAVDDLGIIAEYVKITTYEDEPCIELGEGDSDFKLRITNTQMMFTEGSTVLAYFTNQSFNSKKVVVEEELQQGGFVWKIRSNGNLALIWKGDE